MADDIKKYDFKKGLPLEFEITALDAIFKSSKHILTSPHRTNFYSIIWFQEGTPTHIVDFKPVKVQMNSLLFIGKGKVHYYDKSGDFSGMAIFFTDSFFARTEYDLKFLHSVIAFNDLVEAVTLQINGDLCIFADLFRLMETEYNSPVDNYHADILRNHLHNLLLLAGREQRKKGVLEIKKGPDLDYTLLFKDTLDKEFRQLKSVGEYANRIHISEKRLNKATSNILGKLPKQLIDDRVLLEAKRMLVHSNLSIKEIGFELGFEEPTNFNKYFRKHVNKTPLEFRAVYLL